MAGRSLAAALLLILICALASAEEFSFGGRGEDALYEAVSCGDGLFAVGKTTSSDGDLASRTRTGETGWAIRVDETGRRVWDFCSAKSGMFVMTAPHAHADGSFSLVLTDEARTKGEWIVLDPNGRQESRVPLPERDFLCPHGKPGKLVQWAAASGSTGSYLAMLLDHGDGTLCCAALFADGGVRTCGEFQGGDGVLRADEAYGGLLYAGAADGIVGLTRLRPGTAPQGRTIALPGAERIMDALLFLDGSVVLCAQKRDDLCLLRVSAGGDTVFEETLPTQTPVHLAETEAGFAALAGGSVRFYDEDGRFFGEVNAPEHAQDLVRDERGAQVLSHRDARGAKQAVFTHVAQPEREEAEEPVPEETPEVRIAATPTPEPHTAPEKMGDGALALDSGRLLCESVFGGARVTYVDAEGRERWHVRTLIHTAADRLIWETAQVTEDGDILLTGRYETDTENGVIAEPVQALLSADGVLMGIDVVR